MKYVPWGLSIVLIALLLFVFLSKNEEIDSLNRQDAALAEKYNKFVEDANKKQKQLVDDANNKQQQLVEKYTQLLAVANLPEATVSISFPSTRLKSGGVAVISNTSDDNILVVVVVTRPSTGESKNHNLLMNKRSVMKFGQKEGWSFVSGDVITINQSDHKVKTAVVP